MAQQEQNTGPDLTWDEVRRAIERAARENETGPDDHAQSGAWGL